MTKQNLCAGRGWRPRRYPLERLLLTWILKTLWPLLHSIDNLEWRVLDAKCPIFWSILRAAACKRSQLKLDRSNQAVYSSAARWRLGGLKCCIKAACPLSDSSWNHQLSNNYTFTTSYLPYIAFWDYTRISPSQDTMQSITERPVDSCHFKTEKPSGRRVKLDDCMQTDCISSTNYIPPKWMVSTTWELEETTLMTIKKLDVPDWGAQRWGSNLNRKLLSSSTISNNSGEPFFFFGSANLEGCSHEIYVFSFILAMWDLSVCMCAWIHFPWALTSKRYSTYRDFLILFLSWLVTIPLDIHKLRYSSTVQPHILLLQPPRPNWECG